jgi:predicted ATPase/DNA-binding XRE family transcriptional regulator
VHQEPAVEGRMDEEQSFGDWLRNERKKRDISQQELAERIEVSYETVRKIEKGNRRPSKQVAELIAREFSVPIEQLEDFVLFARQGRHLTGRGSVLTYTATPAPAQRPRSILPSPPTTFVGREREVEQLRELLLADLPRLVTLTGAPGIGKTRLSLQTSAKLLDQFEDGVFWVGLSPLSDPVAVVPAICRVLDLKEVSNQSLFDTLADYLQDKRTLLVLDNFEQLIPAGEHVGALLRACTNMKVLVTSREMLHVYGEHEFPVPPMTLPADAPMPATHAQQLRNMQALTQFEAINLFTQRTQAVVPQFQLTQENAQTVVQICHCLDALPLAIELAAARSKMLTPDALLARLDRSLNVLTAGMQDLPVRQRTLRGAIAWSYDLLSEEEKALYRQMSVFVGTATFDALQEIYSRPTEAGGQGGAGSTESMLDLVQSLLDKSLLRQDERSGEPKFLMLWTIREFGQERLEESGEAQATRRRHASYFLKLAEEAEPHLTSAARAVWLNRLESEYNNLRAALEWCFSSEGDKSDRETGLRLAGALHWFWYFRGYFTEGREWLEKALTSAGAVGRTGAKAKALNAAGRLAFYQYDFPAARAKLEESVDIWRSTGNKRGLAYALTDLGRAFTDGSVTLPGGHELIETSVELFRELEDPWGLAFSLDALADEETALFGFERGEPLYRESLGIFRQLGDKWGMGTELRELGDWALRRGEYASARSILEEAMAMERESGDKWSLALLARTLGDAAYLQGDYSVARTLYDEAIELNRELGNKRRLAGSLRVLGHVMRQLGDYTQAERYYRESLALFQNLDNRLGVTVALVAFAALFSDQGRHEVSACILGFVGNMITAEGIYHVVDHVEYERSMVGARRVLDEDTFEAALNRGQAMTLEQVVAYASEALVEAF